jgi:hypothetical protein
MVMPPGRAPSAGETGFAGAEGATAPETLRQKDRARGELWKAGAKVIMSLGASPKM